MNSKELLREIGNIDDGIIDEALEVYTHNISSHRSFGRYRQRNYGQGLLRQRRKAGFIVVAAILVLMLVTTGYPGGMTALASRISNYISGIIKTRTDSIDLGSAQSLNTGRVEGLDENLCKRYTSYQDLENDIGLDLLEYKQPYKLELANNVRPIRLQYLDFNESASISVCIATINEAGNPIQFSYDMAYLIGSNGKLGNFTFDGDDMELETYTHPILDIPVAVVQTREGMGFACFIYNDVRYTIMGVKGIDTLKYIIENME